MSEATELYNLRRIYAAIRNDSDFDSLEDFIDWAADYYKAGYTVYKRNLARPYSKTNCYWYYRVKKNDNVTSPICEGCAENLPVCETTGCVKYHDWFVTNWNEKYCIRPKEEPQVETPKEYFRYEHPDLVREGIVFEGSGSV